MPTELSACQTEFVSVSKAFATVSFLALVISSMALVLADRADSETFPGPNGKIAFSSDRDGNDEIYVMDADGSNQIRLTTRAETDTKPSLNASGTQIVFEGAVGGSRQIFKMNIDGSNLTQLTVSIG